MSTFVPSGGFSRRRFLHGAALSGAAAISAPSLFAQSGSSGGSGEPVTSLIRPEAPSQPDAVPLAPPDKQPPNLEVPEPRKKLGWAVVGLGELALGEIMPAFGSCRDSRPTALVSGHPDKARKVAEVYGVDPEAIYDYENFDSIKDNSDIDIVYIVLPNSMHAEFSIRALEAGKHVLCEKPLAVTVEECERMIEAAKKADRKLGVAYRLHYEPRNLAVMEMCREKKYGDVKTFTGSFCQNVQAPNIRLSGPLGGGPLGDMGVYCVNAARYTIGEEPLEAIGTQVQPTSDPRFREVPETISFLLRYPSGVVAECECSFGTSRKSNYEVLCSEGSILMNPAYDYRGLRLFTNELRDGTAVQVQHLIPDIDQFAAEMDAFSAAVEKNGPVSTPGEMGLADMRIVLAVLESIRRGGDPVKIGGAAI